MEGNEKAIVYAVAAACILGIIVIGVLMVLSHPMDEGFSELYFENPEGLPNSIDVGHMMNFSFDVVSHEKTAAAYIFNVTYDGFPVRTGSFNLGPQQRQKINVTFVPQRSSLILLDTSRIAKFRTVLDSQTEPIQLDVSGTTLSPEMLLAPRINNLMIRAWNSSELVMIGNPDSMDYSNFSNVSSLGYILRNMQYSLEEKNGLKYLNHESIEKEYRYGYKNVSISVSSHGGPSRNASNSKISHEGKRNYEVHFWFIVRDDPRRLFDL